MNTFKKLFLLVISVAVLFSNAQTANAYDNDTHFWLTYYLAVKSGYTPTQAQQIASATISVDFDKNTEPLMPRAFSPSEMFDFIQNVRARLHALPKNERLPNNTVNIFQLIEACKKEENNLDAMKAEVRKGQDDLWKNVVDRVGDRKDNPGVFLHYLQDRYAHFQFKSYAGHACYLGVDFLDSRREVALEMTRETVKYLREYMKIRWADKPLPPAPDWREVDATLNRFFERNKSEGIVESALYTLLDNNSDRKLNIFSKKSREEFTRAWNKVFETRPISLRAREIIKIALNLPDEKVPDIFLYDLKSSGEVSESRTSKILLYKKSDRELPESASLSRKNTIPCRDDNKIKRFLNWRVDEFSSAADITCKKPK